MSNIFVSFSCLSFYLLFNIVFIRSYSTPRVYLVDSLVFFSLVFFYAHFSMFAYCFFVGSPKILLFIFIFVGALPLSYCFGCKNVSSSSSSSSLVRIRSVVVWSSFFGCVLFHLSFYLLAKSYF